MGDAHSLEPAGEQCVTRSCERAVPCLQSPILLVFGSGKGDFHIAVCHAITVDEKKT